MTERDKTAEESIELWKAAFRVERALIDRGLNPSYHMTVMNRHKREWPKLWEALDDLMEVLRG